MIARVSTTQGSQEKLEAGIHGIREGAPTIRKMDGCLGTTYLVDRKSGRLLGVTLWESEEKLRASEVAINQMRAQTSQDAGAQGAQSEVYEVIIQN
jgi:quinol monooxygenase YgiN